jgi:predicted alpha/beta superfamily hydrolase
MVEKRTIQKWQRLNKKALLFWMLLLSHFVIFAQFSVTIQLQSRPALHRSDPIFIAGNFNGWNPGLSGYDFRVSADSTVVVKLNGIAAGLLEYKITRGSWASVECRATGAAISNRIAQISSDTTLIVEVAAWADDIPGRPPVSTRSKNVFVLDTALFMPQLNRSRRIWVYLPENYAFNNKRYPVLYMHDGQNLFDALTSSFGEWGVDEMMDTMKLRKQCIIVGIDHGDSKRLTEYNPYKSRFGDGEGDAYIDFLVQTLKPLIDQRFRTKTDVANTSIAGSSMGGLISLYALLKYPTVFGNAGVFSPAFWIAPDLKKKIEAISVFKSAVYFVCGELEGDQMTKDMQQTYQLLKQKGLKRTQYKQVKDGQHNERFWQHEMDEFYEWLFNQTR